MTAAEKYRQLKDNAFSTFLEDSFSAESLKGVDLFELKCPSGLSLKCRKAGTGILSQLGQMPMALSASVLASQGKGYTDEQAQQSFAAMSDTERRAAIEASAKMVQFIAVEPRLVVGDVGNRNDAISVDMLTLDDFNYLAKWAGGGEAAEGLKTFRSKRK